MLMESRSEDRHFLTLPSDIELGRRFPSEEILAKLAGALDLSPDELKQYDTRAPIADLKRLIDLGSKAGLCVQNGCGKGKERRTDCRRYNR